MQTQFGWHVIRVDDERAGKFPGFEEASRRSERMHQQTVTCSVSDLRAKAKIE